MSAPHPLASLLEARPHIFRSGRGRTRGQWSTSRGNQGVGPRLALPAAAPEPGLAPQVKSRTPAGSPGLCARMGAFLFTHSFNRHFPPPALCQALCWALGS